MKDIEVCILLRTPLGMLPEAAAAGVFRTCYACLAPCRAPTERVTFEWYPLPLLLPLISGTF